MPLIIRLQLQSAAKNPSKQNLKNVKVLSKRLHISNTYFMYICGTT